MKMSAWSLNVLGIKFDYSSYRNQWSVHTISPDLYRRRRNLEASLAFAFNPNLYMTAGISATELELEVPTVRFEPSRAAIAAMRYRSEFDSGEEAQNIDAGYEVHTASHSLESDFIYTRHLFDGRYVFRAWFAKYRGFGNGRENHRKRADVRTIFAR